MPQLLSSCASTRACVQQTTEPTCPGACAPQLERSLSRTHRVMKRSRIPQQRYHVLQIRPDAAKKNKEKRRKRWGRTWLVWTLISYDCCPYKKRRDTETHRENHVIMEERLEWCIYKPRNAEYCQRPQKLREKHGTDSTLESSERAWPCWNFDLRHLASRTVVSCFSKPPTLWYFVMAALRN